MEIKKPDHALPKLGTPESGWQEVKPKQKIKIKHKPYQIYGMNDDPKTKKPEHIPGETSEQRRQRCLEIARQRLKT